MCNTFSESSNFSPLRRGSRPPKGLSFVVGDPLNTYSTILAPRPPVESRGLSIKEKLCSQCQFEDHQRIFTLKFQHCPNSNQRDKTAEASKSPSTRWNHAILGCPVRHAIARVAMAHWLPREVLCLREHLLSPTTSWWPMMRSKSILDK